MTKPKLKRTYTKKQHEEIMARFVKDAYDAGVEEGKKRNLAAKVASANLEQERVKVSVALSTAYAQMIESVARSMMAFFGEGGLR